MKLSLLVLLTSLGACLVLAHKSVAAETEEDGDKEEKGGPLSSVLGGVKSILGGTTKAPTTGESPKKKQKKSTSTVTKTKDAPKVKRTIRMLETLPAAPVSEPEPEPEKSDNSPLSNLVNVSPEISVHAPATANAVTSDDADKKDESEPEQKPDTAEANLKLDGSNNVRQISIGNSGNQEHIRVEGSGNRKLTEIANSGNSEELVAPNRGRLQQQPLVVESSPTGAFTPSPLVQVSINNNEPTPKTAIPVAVPTMVAAPAPAPSDQFSAQQMLVTLLGSLLRQRQVEEPSLINQLLLRNSLLGASQQPPMATTIGHPMGGPFVGAMQQFPTALYPMMPQPQQPMMMPMMPVFYSPYYGWNPHPPMYHHPQPHRRPIVIEELDDKEKKPEPKKPLLPSPPPPPPAKPKVDEPKPEVSVVPKPPRPQIIVLPSVHTEDPPKTTPPPPKELVEWETIRVPKRRVIHPKD